MKTTVIAIIGCGTIANASHIPSYLANPKAEIKYFCDIIPERASAAVEKYNPFYGERAAGREREEEEAMPRNGRQIKRATELEHVEEIRDKLDEIAVKNGRTRYSVGMDLVRNLEDEIQAILMAIVLDDVEATVDRIAKKLKERSEEAADRPEPEDKP